ncbi:MAG: hypothetical protein ACRD3O_06275 [Terriglobia bacterium]
MNLPPDAVDLSTAVLITTFIAATGVLITSLEDLVDLRLFRAEGLLNWDVMRLQGTWSARGWSGRVSNILFNYRGFKIFLSMRLVAATTLFLFAKNHAVFLLSCLIILLSLVALSIRAVYGLDGAHQMFIVIFGALFLGGIAGENSIAQIFSVWFIALQAGMSYFISGVNKLFSSVWRSGDALIGIFGTRSYGHSATYSLISTRPTLARVLSWTVILFECGFCLIFAVHLHFAFWILLIGLVFHISTAISMGLNGFFFAFVATYPCIAYCVTVLHA